MVTARKTMETTAHRLCRTFLWFDVVDFSWRWDKMAWSHSDEKYHSWKDNWSITITIFQIRYILHKLVSDNGPQFVSDEYKQFCDANRIRLILVAPYYPSSNGEAERFVQMFKAALRKADQKGLQLALTQFLLKYKTTPHPATGKTPAELIFGRQVRTRLDLLHPSEKGLQKGEKEENNEWKKRTFEAGEPVWMWNYSGNEKWIPGVVILKSGPLSYTIGADGQEHKRHVDQLKKWVRRERNSDDTGDKFMPILSEQIQNVLEPESDILRNRFPILMLLITNLKYLVEVPSRTRDDIDFMLIKVYLIVLDIKEWLT